MNLPIIQNDGLPECKGCGACCFLQGYGVYLNSQDVERLPSDLVRTKEYFHERDEYYYLKTNGVEHCIGFDPTKRECKIYNIRPDNCRNFDRGNSWCRSSINRAFNLNVQETDG